ncbi:tail tape measure protein [Sphingomonas sp. TREG-RG-20F-R18-01]|uniref:tail tape measure protein n=1 Tax=Sphingomonas sp. TREG-RG-20F-R18-01 TaxID=2914982 RepID=UPI001F598137|nr:tail tape measure protein [Sphingomonas sp. TREG-RG-20F-R18-01]
MEDEIERLVVGVRADTAGFARDVDTMRASLDGPFTGGVDRAGRAIETALGKALQTGSVGFEDLRKVALSVLDDIAGAALRNGLNALFGGGDAGGGGATGLLGALSGLVGGAPGRATGGPVSPARPYWVGERGPELFVPTASGSIVAAGGGQRARDVRVSITVQGGTDGPQALAASSRQVARAVKAALSGP